MVSQSIAWGYVVIICLMLILFGVQELNINRTIRENEELRKENKKIKESNDKFGVRMVALQVANTKLTKDLEATTRELKAAETILKRAGA